MKRVLILAAVSEAATGVALLIVPSLVGQLLFGEELTGVAIPVARVTGIALIALGVACWPGPPLVGMLIYSAVITLYLAYVGFAGSLTGILLWPAVVLHVILTALLTHSLMHFARMTKNSGRRASATTRRANSPQHPNNPRTAPTEQLQQ
jgi:hypothetical protein